MLDEVLFGVVEVIHPRLAGVEVWWWNPFGAAVFAFSRCPTTVFDEAIVRSAGQRGVGDVGFTVVGDPAIHVVDLTPIARSGAAGPGAASLQVVQHDALSGGGEAFGTAAVERLAGVLVID